MIKVFKFWLVGEEFFRNKPLPRFISIVTYCFWGVNDGGRLFEKFFYVTLFLFFLQIWAYSASFGGEKADTHLILYGNELKIVNPCLNSIQKNDKILFIREDVFLFQVLCFFSHKIKKEYSFSHKHASKVFIKTKYKPQLARMSLEGDDDFFL